MLNDKTIKLTMRIAGLAAASGLLAGCSDYLARHDGVSFDAGDAAARNAAIHMIDPWPRHSANDRIDVDGQRLAVGMKKYKTNDYEKAGTKSKNAATISAPNGQSSTSN